jgi:hypothetical protein
LISGVFWAREVSFFFRGLIPFWCLLKFYTATPRFRLDVKDRLELLSMSIGFERSGTGYYGAERYVVIQVTGMVDNG